MNLQKILVSGILVGVVSFFLGWLIWGILLADFTKIAGMAPVSRAETDMVMWAMIASNLLWGIFLAYVFVQWANITTFQTGAIAGATLGFIIVLALDMGFYAMTTMYTIEDIVKDVLINTVYMALLGGILGWWLGRK